MTEKCKGCGARMIDTGPPIWESFCSNEECTHDHDTFWNNFRKDAQEWKRVQKIKDAGPELLEALKLLEDLVSAVGMGNSPTAVKARKAIAKAEGKK